MRQIAQKQREEAERVAAEARSAARDAGDAVRRLVTGGAAEAEKLLSKEAETGGRNAGTGGTRRDRRRRQREDGGRGGEWEDGGGGRDGVGRARVRRRVRLRADAPARAEPLGQDPARRPRRDARDARRRGPPLMADGGATPGPGQLAEMMTRTRASSPRCTKGAPRR